jgi:hypothetical protein
MKFDLRPTRTFQDRAAWAPRYLNLNSAQMLWHEAVSNAFLRIQEANLFSDRWLAVLFLNLASPCGCNGGFEINAVSIE